MMINKKETKETKTYAIVCDHGSGIELAMRHGDVECFIDAISYKEARAKFRAMYKGHYFENATIKATRR